MHPDDLPLLDLEGLPSDHRIVVAMSGGVDSSVVAALLHHKKYNVVGVTLQLYDHGAIIQKKGACCAGQDIYDAQKVADKIGFPHFVLDYESKFKESVIDNFVDTYLNGETPIPCVKCNMDVKFKDLLNFSKQMNASAMATGHYIQRKKGVHNNELHRAIDPMKDQSYFLYGTTQPQIDYVHFPLGSLEKAQTRSLAEYFGLTIAHKSDSQDICFVPNGHYTDVIEKHRPNALIPGPIYNMNGTKLGEHRGIIHYTIGQRKGLNLPGGTSTPLYVVKIDAHQNTIYVGEKKHLYQKEITISDVNWLGDQPINENPIPIAIKIRSTQLPQTGMIYQKDNQYIITLSQGERAISPGQAAVFYSSKDDHNRLLGGGVIVK